MIWEFCIKTTFQVYKNIYNHNHLAEKKGIEFANEEKADWKEFTEKDEEKK